MVRMVRIQCRPQWTPGGLGGCKPARGQGAQVVTHQDQEEDGWGEAPGSGDGGGADANNCTRGMGYSAFGRIKCNAFTGGWGMHRYT